MLAMGADSTADASDYSIMPASVTFPERTRGSYTTSMTVEGQGVRPDNELEDMEMLVLDAKVTGAVTDNGTEPRMIMDPVDADHRGRDHQADRAEKRSRCEEGGR